MEIRVKRNIELKRIQEIVQKSEIYNIEICLIIIFLIKAFEMHTYKMKFVLNIIFE